VRRAPRPQRGTSLSDLVGELSTRSEEFRVRWAAHDVLLHRSGVMRFRHPLAGELSLGYEDLDLPADPGQTILVFTAEPGSPSEEAPRELARSRVPLEADRKA
jgi:hypothetical protein